MRKKRILSGALGLFMLLSVLCGGVIGASASGDVTVSTSIAYNVGDPTYVTVTSKIKGVEEGEQITYLSYSGVEPERENIVFVDQLEVDGNDVEGGAYFREFTYTALASKISSTVVRFGAENTDVSTAPGNDKNPDIFSYDVAVGSPDGGTVTIFVKNVEGEWEELSSPQKVIQGDVMIELTPDDKKRVSGLTVYVNDEDQEVDVIPDGDGVVSVVLNVNGNLAVEAAFSDKIEGDPVIADGRNFNVTGGTNLGGEVKTAVAFSQITVPSGIEEYEYGVLLYFDSLYDDPDLIDWSKVIEPDAETNVTRNGIYKFEAMAKTEDGKFAVKLIDDREGGSNVLEGGGFYLRPYLKIDADVMYGNDVEY